MSKYLGDYDASTVIYGKFSTYQPSTGATFTLSGSPAIAVYKDASTTQSTSGVTLTPDFDSVTGLNHFAVDTSSDGTFYSAGSFFDVTLSAGAVDSVTISGSAIASFTLRHDSSLKSATPNRPLVVDAAGLADATTVKLGPSGSGTAQTARDIGANVLLSSGTGSGQLSFTSGVVKSDPWPIALPGAYSSGSAGFILGNLAAGADPWATALPGSYSAGEAGYILGHRLSIASNTVKNVALNDFEFVLVDSSGVPVTGRTVTATRSIDGGAVSSCANSVSEVSNGIYSINLATSDLNGNVITLRFTATGAQDRLITVITTP